jgi:hypothetical protein
MSTEDCKQLHIPLGFEARLIAARTSRCSENIYPFALNILRNVNCSYTIRVLSRALDVKPSTCPQRSSSLYQ